MDVSHIELITTSLTPWHWMTAGILLIGLELFAPTTILLWPGIAALITGLLTLVIPELSWQLQVALFAVVTIMTTLAGRKLYKKNSQEQKSSSLNRRADKLIGRHITLADAINNGVGGTYIDGTRWRVIGPDADAGAVMVVTEMDGSSLVVEPSADNQTAD